MRAAEHPPHPCPVLPQRLGLMREVQRLSHLDCLAGAPPPPGAPRIEPDDAAVGDLMGCVCLGGRPPDEPLARVWLRDLRWNLLFNALILQGLQGPRRPAPASLADLACLSGLSQQSVHLALRAAREAGEFETDRSGLDRRFLSFRASAEAGALAERQRAAFTDTIARFCRRPDPGARLSGRNAEAWRAIFLELGFSVAGRTPARAANLALLGRVSLLWPLLLHGPDLTSRVVAREVAFGRGSRQTVRNHLSWLRGAGWLAEDARQVAPTALAWRRFGAMLTCFARRAHLTLDLLEMLAEEEPRQEAVPHAAVSSQPQIASILGLTINTVSPAGR